MTHQAAARLWSFRPQLPAAGRLQVASEDDGVIRYEILDPERDADGELIANRGLLALDQAARAAVRVRPAGGPERSDGQPDRVRGGARGRDRGRGRREAGSGSGRVQRGRLPGHACAAGLAGGTAGRAGRTAAGSCRGRSSRSSRVSRKNPETARIRSALLARVSAETGDGRTRALLADLLDWHRREDKPAWWRYLPPPHAEPGRTGRRAGRAGRLPAATWLARSSGQSCGGSASRPRNTSSPRAARPAIRPRRAAGRSARWTTRAGRST